MGPYHPLETAGFLVRRGAKGGDYLAPGNHDLAKKGKKVRWRVVKLRIRSFLRSEVNGKQQSGLMPDY
jgi:hypothetical protein